MKVLDSNVYVGLFLEDDSLNKLANKEISQIEGETIILPHSIIAETATTLIYRHSKERADLFVKYVQNSSRFDIIETTFDRVSTAWLKTSKKISYFDILILQTAIDYDAELITFDKQLNGLYKSIKDYI